MANTFSSAKIVYGGQEVIGSNLIPGETDHKIIFQTANRAYDSQLVINAA